MWVIFSLSSAIISAIYNLTSQNIKIDANTFMIYRGLFMPILLLPFLIMNPVTFSFNFYIMSFAQGCISAYVDYLVFGINKKYGAETVSSITPFSVILIFFMWCFIDYSIVIKYIQNPIQTAFILISLCGIVFSLAHYYKVKFTREAFVKMIPVVTLSAIFAVLNKAIMNYSEDNQFMCACWRIFIVGLVIGVIHLHIYIKKSLKLKLLILPRNILKSFIFILPFMYMLFKSYADYYAANPAYVSSIVYTSLIWVMLFSKYIPFFRFKDAKLQGEKKWKILFVFSIILLLIVTNY